MNSERSQLTRVLELEAMDTPEEARDYDTMDHGEVNRRFVADFLAAQRQAGLAPHDEVLDLGTGTAQIPIELCAQHPAARVVAIDLAESMLRLARENVVRRGLERQIVIERIDAKHTPYFTGRFAAVMSNSIVHHIPFPAVAVEEALRVLQCRGGLIFIRDLARPRDDQEVRHLVDIYAAGANAHQRQLFDASLRAALSLEEMRVLVARFGLNPADVQATSDRHWTWSAVRK